MHPLYAFCLLIHHENTVCHILNLLPNFITFIFYRTYVYFLITRKMPDARQPDLKMGSRPWGVLDIQPREIGTAVNAPGGILMVDQGIRGKVDIIFIKVYSKKMNKKITSIFIMAILCFGTMAFSQDRAEEKMALESANGWLVYIDNEEYLESWNTAASILQNTITPDQWIKTLSGVRKSLGKLISRKVITQKHCHSLPGVPDGSYFVIQYCTKFKNTERVMETITMAKEKDASWKSVGYFIK